MRTNQTSSLLITGLLFVGVLLACRANPAASETDIPSLNTAAHSEPDTVNVMAYGAIPDDGEDDTVAIQQAIDTGSDVIYVPPGEFLVTRIELGGEQTLTGAGMYTTRFKLPDNTVAPTREVGILGLTFKDGAEEVAFRNFEYDGNTGGEGNRDWLGQMNYGSLGANGIYLGGARQKTPPRLAIIENVFIHDTARNGIVWGDRVQVIGRNWHIRNSDGDHLIYDSGDRDTGAEPVQSEVDGVILEGYARGPLLVTNSTRWSNVTFRNVAANPASPALWRNGDVGRDRNRGRSRDRTRDRGRGRDRDRGSRDRGSRDRDSGERDRKDDGPFRTGSLINERGSGYWGSSFDGVTVENLDPSIAGPRGGFAGVKAAGSIQMSNVEIELTGDSRRAFRLIAVPGGASPTKLELNGIRIVGAGSDTRLLTFYRPEGASLAGARFSDFDIAFLPSSTEGSPLFELSGQISDLEISRFRLRGGAPILAQLGGGPSDSFADVVIRDIEADAIGRCLVEVTGGTLEDVSLENITIPTGGTPVVDTRRGGAVGSVRVGRIRRAGG